MARLHMLVEQSIEWISPLYISFIDYEQTFDSVNRKKLWKLLWHYGIPENIGFIIRFTYKDKSCTFQYAGQLSNFIEEKTGVCQGCLLSSFLFLFAIDYITKTTTSGRNNGTQWSFLSQPDNFNFTDDLEVLSHNHRQMQNKTSPLKQISVERDLKVNNKKSWWKSIQMT